MNHDHDERVTKMNPRSETTRKLWFKILPGMLLISLACTVTLPSMEAIPEDSSEATQLAGRTEIELQPDVTPPTTDVDPESSPEMPQPFIELPGMDVQPHITPPLTEMDPQDQIRELCNPGNRIVALIVDPRLREGIRAGLLQFEIDLCQEGYSVLIHTHSYTLAADLRAYLSRLYTSSDGLLAGSILIGEMPYAYQWVTLHTSNPALDPLEEEVISFQYYADLDGRFERSPGYSSPGGHSESYDLHLGEVDWEQWIGVLPMVQDDYVQSVGAIHAYFEKNHLYRTGGYEIANAFMVISEHASATSLVEHDQVLGNMRSGTYAWTPFSLEPGAGFYFDSSAVGMTADDGYDRLPDGEADFVVGQAHGYWGGHGRLDIAWVSSHPIRSVFFWSDGCAVGNLDYPENFLTSVLYAPLSSALLAKGTTNNSGGLGTNSEGYYGHNIATAMADGASLGDALLRHVNVPLIYPWSESREFHFATAILLGDPTLRR
jgi:hypothetical protein